MYNKTYPAKLISKNDDKLIECQLNVIIANECRQLKLNKFIE